MTVDEYRAKHKRCKTCEYARGGNCGCWYCMAKQRRYLGDLGYTKIQGCFCRLYKAKEFKE